MTRREWLAAGALAVSGACGRKKGAGFPGYALIATAGENSVAAVDLTAFRFAGEIGVGAAPMAIAAGGPANHSYVLTPSSGSVHVIDSNLNRVGSRRLAEELSQFRLTPDGIRLVCIGTKSRELIEADARTLNVTGRLRLPVEPTGMDVTAGGLAAIASTGDRSVQLIDLKTGEQAKREMPGPVGEVRFRKDSKVLLVANPQARSLTVLDVPTLQVLADLPLAMQPQNLCFNSDQGQLFVSGEGMDGVAIIFPYGTLEVEQTVLAGHDPGAMVCSEKPGYLFVASASGSDVCILDVGTRKMIGLVEVGQNPSYLAVTPDSQYALVLDETSGDMAVIHVGELEANLSNPAKVRNKSAASLFTMLPVGSKPVQAVIVPSAA